MSRRAELAAFGRRSQTVLLLSAVTGALVGLGVALFDWVTRNLTFDSLLRAPVAVQAFGPLAGLGLAALALRYVAAGATPASSDEYIKTSTSTTADWHCGRCRAACWQPSPPLGLGGALGLEGPSIYLGASIGSVIQRRFSRLFSRDDTKLLLVAGAAAGVAAIFKAPATGAIPRWGCSPTPSS